MSILSRYKRNFLRVILRKRRLSVPKAPKLKIRHNLEEYSEEMEKLLEDIERAIGKPNLPETTRSLLQSLIKSTMILKETEIDKESIERISGFQRMLLDPEDFTVWLSYWMEDQLSLIRMTLETMEEGFL